MPKNLVPNTIQEILPAVNFVFTQKPAGSWGDKYGARIELWFEPSNGKKDYKITQRNYIVEGWMR